MGLWGAHLRRTNGVLGISARAFLANHMHVHIGYSHQGFVTLGAFLSCGVFRARVRLSGVLVRRPRPASISDLAADHAIGWRL